MLISFSGPQSSGKSTLLNRCREIFEDPKWTFVPEITRAIQRKGLPINEAGNDFTQLFILNAHLENAFLKNAILDRCIFDGFVYTYYLSNYQNSVSQRVVDYAQLLYDLLIKKYDIIFYTSPEDVTLVDDGVRSINTEFRNDIIRLFNYRLAELDERGKLVILKGSVEERLDIIKNVVKFYAKNEKLPK